MTRYTKLISIFLFSLFALSAPFAQGQSFRILVSNDDGIDSPQLAALKQALQRLPDVEVVISAPHQNQSGASHSSIGAEEFLVEQAIRDGEFFGYAVHGRPADAVRWAVMTLGTERSFDLVVAGINRGANVGNVAHLSGTVGAAMEGQYLGIPSIAVSEETSDVDTQASAEFAARLVQKIRQEGLPHRTIISVNIPGGELKGVRVMPMGDSYLHTTGFTLTSEDDVGARYQRQRIRQSSQNPNTDTFAYLDGYITITPLKFDWTAYEFMDELESWDLR